jgi:hypothetical protein
MVPLSTAHLFVRWLHVLAMAVAVGGAVLAWGVSRVGDAATTLTVGTAYETVFWAAVGTLVMTGVGNLGSLAPALPRGTWGVAFLGKVGLLLAVLVGSAVRTATVWAAGRHDEPVGAPIGRGYALTAGALIVALGLAQVMAHG